MTAMQPPSTPAVTLDSLAPQKCWVAWQIECSPHRPEPTKVPYIGIGRPAKANAETWLTRAQAEVVDKQLPKPHGVGGIGLELTAVSSELAMGGVDLDQCVDQTRGEIEPWALQVIERLASYAEV